MYGDTEVIRRHAARIREQGVDIRTMADQLVSQVENIAWTGRAADTMRERIRERASRLREAAGRHDTAADSFEKHLGEVESAKESIAAVQRRATALVTDARGRVAAVGSHDDLDGIQRRADPVDEEIAAFNPPETGHKDWLTIDIPGL